MNDSGRPCFHLNTQLSLTEEGRSSAPRLPLLLLPLLSVGNPPPYNASLSPVTPELLEEAMKHDTIVYVHVHNVVQAQRAHTPTLHKE